MLGSIFSFIVTNTGKALLCDYEYMHTFEMFLFLTRSQNCTIDAGVVISCREHMSLCHSLFHICT